MGESTKTLDYTTWLVDRLDSVIREYGSDASKASEQLYEIGESLKKRAALKIDNGFEGYFMATGILFSDLHKNKKEAKSNPIKCELKRIRRSFEHSRRNMTQPST